MTDHPTLSSARTAADIIEATVRREWWLANDGAEYAGEVPTEEDLAAWSPGCPDAAQAGSAELAAACGLIGPDSTSPLIPADAWRWQAMGNLDVRKAAVAELSESIGPGADFDGIVAILESHGAIVIRPRLVFAAGLRLDSRDADPVHGIAVWDLPELHQRWMEVRETDPEARHPLARLVAAWLNRPREVELERRRDQRILPRIVAGGDPPEREAGMLFGGLHEGRRVEAPELPLWPDVAPAKRVPILDLVDAAGVPVMARGPGAPLEMRLFVRALASVRPKHRDLMAVRIAPTLRELRDGLFPTRWERRRDWPRLRDALLHARDYAVHDGRGRWFPVALRSMPDDPALDDVIVLDIAYPPGSHSGPPVALPEMDRLSVESAPRWRAYIAAHSVAWQPGNTRVKHPRSGRFVWTRDLAAYPVLTLDDRRRFAFGAGDSKHRTRAEIDAAFRRLPGLVVVSEAASNDRTGEVGWIVIPKAAAAVAVPKSGGRPEPEHANRGK